MNSENGRNRRRFFRLAIPAGEELTAWIMGTEQLVNELSEKSLRFTSPYVPNIDGVCQGIIRWSDGRVAHFTGTIGPLSQSQRVVVDIRGIAMSDVIKEQRRLLIKFPVLKSD